MRLICEDCGETSEHSNIWAAKLACPLCDSAFAKQLPTTDGRAGKRRYWRSVPRGCFRIWEVEELSCTAVSARS